MNVAMTPWIHTRWHQLILSLLERLKSLDQCHRLGNDGWGLRTLSPGIPVTGETTVMIDISKITDSFREWKAPLGSPCPPVSTQLPFPYPGVICVRRHFLVSQESLGWKMIKLAFSHFRSKSVISWNLISKCLKSHLYLTDIVGLGSQTWGEKHGVLKRIHLHCLNLNMI